jgi:tripartite-type tricarboxylate transporter receptor subunit TctC
MNKINTLRTAAVALLAMGLQASAWAQAHWPSKPIRMIVAAAPGGSTDSLGRAIAQRLSERLGQPVVVENKGGAAGGVAAQFAAAAPADGYTLLMTNDQMVVQASFPTKLPYDPIKDFAPVSLVARGPVVLGVNPSVKANSVAELVALAKAQPGKMAFSSCGAGTVLHLAGELLNLSAGINLTHVPYKGCAPAMADVVAGHVPIFFTVLGNAVPFEKAGKVKLLGVASAKRLPGYPNLPTINEAGIRGFIADPWFGLVVSAQTPKEIVNKLASEMSAVLDGAELKEAIRGFSLEPANNGPEEFAEIMKSDLARWTAVVTRAKVKID